jgi:luciferase-like monooxygenase
MAVPGAHERIISVVSGWEEVEIRPHRYGGQEFRLGKRELGHIHGNSLVDIPFPKLVRNEIVAAGEAEPHHILPNSGWVSVFLRTSGDVDRAIALLERSFQLAIGHRKGAAAKT